MATLKIPFVAQGHNTEAPLVDVQPSYYVVDLDAEKPSSGLVLGDLVYAKDNKKLYKSTGAASLIELAPVGGSGEANTASNVGSAGTGVFKVKTGVDLRFKNLNPKSAKITILDDIPNSNIDFDIVGAADHNHTSAADDGGVLTNDEHDGFSEYGVIATPITPAAGKIRLSAFDQNGRGVMEVIGDGGNVLRITRDNTIIAKVDEAAGVAKREVVYISGASGANELIKKWTADGSIAADLVGVTMEAGALNEFVHVMALGKLTKVDTSGFSLGDVVYASATTPGGITATEPTHPNLRAELGIVTRVSMTVGEIIIKPLVVRGDFVGTRRNAWKIGDATAGAKTIDFVASGANIGTLTLTPTGARTLTLPDATGSIPLHAGDIAGGTPASPVIPNNTVSYAKMQDVSAASRLLGRGSAGGAGDPEEIALGSGLTMTGTTLSASGGPGGEAFPVGSVFIAVVATDPNTLLGYGTWAAFGAGRVLVGLDSGDTDFDLVEETGGAKTQTPSAHTGTAVSNHASHTHTHDAVINHTHTVDVNDPGHQHSQQIRNTGTAGTGGSQGANVANNATAGNTGSITTGITATTQNPAGGVASGTTAGPIPTLSHSVTQPSDHAAMSVVQPYIVVYMWKRTA